MNQLAFAVKETSLTCYRQVVAEGLLSRVRLLVWEELARRGPVTGRELDAALAQPGETRTSYHKRLSELQRVGLARVVGTRACRVTGREAEAWEAVDAIPTKPERQETRLERFVGALAAHFEDSQSTWTGPEVAHYLRRAVRGER